MRSRWLVGVIHAVSAALVAGEVLAQSATRAPTPTSGPTEAPRRLPVRIVLPCPESSPDLGQTLPLNPVEVVRTEPATEAKKAPGNELVIAPLPLSNPAIGSGLGFATIAKDRAEHRSPPTTLGGGGFYTSTGSWAGGAGAKLYLKEDRSRATLGAGLGSLEYDLFAEGPEERGIPITQEFEGALGEFMVGLGKRFNAGVRVSYGSTNVGLRKGENGAIPFPAQHLDVTLGAMGLKGERDSRDSVFYPTSGSRLQLLANHSDASFGSDYTYTKTTLSYSNYFSFDEPVVLALQAAGCHVAGEDAPFFGLCLFGTENVLRGYTAGRYLDRSTLAAHAKVRWQFAGRRIATGFAGLGGVRPACSLADDTELLGSGGIGI